MNMSVTVQESQDWSLEYAVDTYKQLDELQDYVLWRTHRELPHGEVLKFYDEIGLSKSIAKRRIEHFNDKAKISKVAPALHTLTETEAIDIVTDEDNPLNKIATSTYAELVGSTPEEKIGFFEEVKEEVKKTKGKYRPSRADIREYKAKKKEETKPKPEKTTDKTSLSEAEAVEIVNKEYDADYYALCDRQFGRGVGILNVGVKMLRQFDDEWKDIYKLLSKSAHPDNGGSAEAQRFLNFCNGVFKEAKSHKKANSKVDEMTDRIADLMGY